MKFRIDNEIFDKFHGLNVGVVIAKTLNNKGHSEEIQEMVRKQEVKAKAANLDDPKIDTWRKTYSAFGAKPKENRSSVENLYRLVQRGGELRSINNLVDIYNLVSLKYILPVGGEDLDRIEGDIVLGFAGATEAPVLLLGDKEARPPHKGEVIYKDSVSAICRRWNWREADRTKLTEETKNCILVIEGLPPATKEEIETATKELKELVMRFCTGNITYTVLDKNQAEISL